MKKALDKAGARRGFNGELICHPDLRSFKELYLFGVRPGSSLTCFLFVSPSRPQRRFLTWNVIRGIAEEHTRRGGIAAQTETKRRGERSGNGWDRSEERPRGARRRRRDPEASPGFLGNHEPAPRARASAAFLSFWGRGACLGSARSCKQCFDSNHANFPAGFRIHQRAGELRYGEPALLRLSVAAAVCQTPPTPPPHPSDPSIDTLLLLPEPRLNSIREIVCPPAFTGGPPALRLLTRLSVR